MKKVVLTFLGSLLLTWSFAQAPDKPISPVEAASMLGKGILFEPQAGDVNLGNSAPYKPKYGDIIKAAGFQSVRIRYQGSNKSPMMKAIDDGPPYDAADDALLDETESIIDDLLNKNLAVVLTFYGLTDDRPGDLEKMTAWWAYVANRFKNKSHRLIFDLFVEPWRLVNNKDPHRIAVYYDSITRAIRKTNPDRLIIYFKVPPSNYKDNTYGPGTDWFITKDFNPIPAAAGIYHIWDFHVLKPAARDNMRLAEQAWEYMDSTKQMVWSGAWASKTTENEMWYARPIAINVTRRLINRGISSAYLMMFDGGTSIYDAQQDHNGNGILDEWTYPGLEKILTSGPGIWWNLLSNPGFELDTAHWIVSDNDFRIKEEKENHFMVLPLSGGSVTVKQNITMALQNNGPGKWDVLGYFSSKGQSKVTFIIEGNADGKPFRYESQTQTITGKPQLITDSIAATWQGNLTSAHLMMEFTGDTVTLDKIGLTRFYHHYPKFDLTLWPGENVHHESYATKPSSVLELNSRIRSLLNQGVSQSDPVLAPLAKKLDSIGSLIDDRMIALIGNGYQHNSNGTQYRIGGYTQGTANVKYASTVKWYLGGKDKTAYQLNQALIAEQNVARDSLIYKDIEFRKFFYDVYKAFPPEINTGINATVSVVLGGGSMMSNEPGAVYRWKDCKNLYNPIGGATNRYFTPDSAGSYAVTVSKNGYTVTSECYQSGPSGIKKYKPEKEVKIYPNPVTDFMHVEVKDVHRPFQMKIWDQQGRLLRTYEHLQPHSRIKIDLSRGIYFAEFIFADGRQGALFMKW
jgi:hypothetical protein